MSGTSIREQPTVALKKDTNHWTNSWKCLWQRHSVNEDRPLLSLSLSPSLSNQNADGVMSDRVLQNLDTICQGTACVIARPCATACLSPFILMGMPRVHARL